jgi:hypothetical protein
MIIRAIRRAPRKHLFIGTLIVAGIGIVADNMVKHASDDVYTYAKQLDVKKMCFPYICTRLDSK